MGGKKQAVMPGKDAVYAFEGGVKITRLSYAKDEKGGNPLSTAAKGSSKNENTAPAFTFQNTKDRLLDATGKKAKGGNSGVTVAYQHEGGIEFIE